MINHTKNSIGESLRCQFDIDHNSYTFCDEDIEKTEHLFSFIQSNFIAFIHKSQFASYGLTSCTRCDILFSFHVSSAFWEDLHHWLFPKFVDLSERKCDVYKKNGTHNLV